MFDKFDLFCLYCKMNLRYLLWNLKIGRETTLSWFIFHNICRVLFPRAQFWSRFLRLESPVNHKRGKWAWLYHYLRSQMIASYNTSTYPVIDVHMQAVIVSFFFQVQSCTYKRTSIVLATATFSLKWYSTVLIRTFY